MFVYNNKVAFKILKGFVFMEKLTINFTEIEDVENFIKIAEKYDFEITLSQGKYSVDGKSLMGIFSLDITKPIEILIDGKNQSVDTLVNEIQKYTIQ